MQFLKILWSKLGSWLGVIAILVILTTTGFSTFLQQAMMQTGMMDAGTEITDSRKLDYRFQLTDLKGNPLNNESLKGKVLFINLWATWCGPCRAEMPSIQRLYEKMDPAKVQFLMISLDKPEDRQKINEFLRKQEFTFPVFVPVQLTDQLNVRSIPTTLIVDPDGRIVRTETGVTQFDTRKFEEFLNNLTRI